MKTIYIIVVLGIVILLIRLSQINKCFFDTEKCIVYLTNKKATIQVFEIGTGAVILKTERKCSECTISSYPEYEGEIRIRIKNTSIEKGYTIDICNIDTSKYTIELKKGKLDLDRITSIGVQTVYFKDGKFDSYGDNYQFFLEKKRYEKKEIYELEYLKY